MGEPQTTYQAIKITVSVYGQREVDISFSSGQREKDISFSYGQTIRDISFSCGHYYVLPLLSKDIKKGFSLSGGFFMA